MSRPRDIRVYKYHMSSLSKPDKRLQHKYQYTDDAEKALDDFVLRRNRKGSEQYVIIEYTSKYESKILEVINYG